MRSIFRVKKNGNCPKSGFTIGINVANIQDWTDRNAEKLRHNVLRPELTDLWLFLNLKLPIFQTLIRRDFGLFLSGFKYAGFRLSAEFQSL
jgi:hypothetical protein